MAASDLADPLMAWHAPLHFHAAAEWAVVAAAGAAGAAIPGGSSAGGQSGKGGNLASNAPAAAKQPEQQPVQVINVQHFQEGALVTQPTLAMVHGNEGVIPLDDTRATRAIADAILTQMRTVWQHDMHQVGDTYNWYIDGMISDNDLNTLTRKISQNVSKGKTRLRASDSIRLTRRS